MSFRQFVIKRFLSGWNGCFHQNNQAMPEHVQARWYGDRNWFYHLIWGRVLGGDRDPHLFDDYCDTSYDVSVGKRGSLWNLRGGRLNRLFWFALAMLVHFRLATAFWTCASLFIGYLVVPVGTWVVLPLYEVLGWAWAIWVLFVSTVYDFLRSLVANE